MGILAYKIITPQYVNSITFSAPMKLPANVSSAKVSIGITTYPLRKGAVVPIVANTFTLNSSLTDYSVSTSDVYGNAEYETYLIFNLTPFSSRQAQALVGRVKTYIVSNSMPSEGFRRVEISNTTTLDDNNNLQVGYPQGTEFDRYAFVTNATQMQLEILSAQTNISNFTYYTSEIGIKIDNKSYEIIKAPNDHKLHFYNVSLPSGIKYVEVISAQQFYRVSIGAWVRAIYVPLNSYIRPADIKPISKVTIFGDSIEGWNGASGAEFDSWPTLLRTDTRLDVTDFSFGGRSLGGTLSTLGMKTLVADLVKGHPSQIWIAIGVNDWGNSVDNATTFGSEYGQLLDLLHSNLSTAIIYAQTPIVNAASNSTNRYDNRLIDYINAIQLDCASRAFVTCVNGTQILQISDLFDGEHPSLEGSVKYYIFVKSILDKALYNISNSQISNSYEVIVNPS